MTRSTVRGLPAWVSPTVLAAAGAYLALRWNDLPERWITHWGRGGIPNGWTARTWLGALAPLLFGLALWAFLELIVALVRAGVRSRPETEAMVAATVPLVRWISLSISLVVAFLAIDLPLGHPHPRRVAAFSLLLLLGAIAAGSVQASLAFERARSEGALPLPVGYHWAYYYNRDDPRLWVPKLSRLGATVNFAHPLAWPVMLLLVGGPLLLAAFIVRQVAR